MLGYVALVCLHSCRWSSRPSLPSISRGWVGVTWWFTLLLMIFLLHTTTATWSLALLRTTSSLPRSGGFSMPQLYWASAEFAVSGGKGCHFVRPFAWRNPGQSIRIELLAKFYFARFCLRCIVCKKVACVMCSCYTTKTKGGVSTSIQTYMLLISTLLTCLHIGRAHWT